MWISLDVKQTIQSNLLMYVIHKSENNSDNFLITDRLNQLNQTLNGIEGKKYFYNTMLLKIFFSKNLTFFYA